MKNNTKAERKKQRRKDAEQRQAIRAKRSPEEQQIKWRI